MEGGGPPGGNLGGPRFGGVPAASGGVGLNMRLGDETLVTRTGSDADGSNGVGATMGTGPGEDVNCELFAL